MKYQQPAGKPNVLVVNNDKLTRKSIYEMLCRYGYAVDLADSIEETLKHLDNNPRRVVLTDVNGSGNELLKIIKKQNYPCQIIILTSYGNIESAVDSIKIGAFDYLVRPVEDKKIVSAIKRAFANIPLSVKEQIFPKDPPKNAGACFNLVGNSPQMKEIYSLINRISNTKATILLRGESGTGKRMLAQAIHKADKKRHNKPFIEVSCGALPREIIESELFGHTRGAFTGAIADRKGRFELGDGGTMLLDDIDSFSLDLQVKLLRILQQKEYERVGDHKTLKTDVRIIASTNQDLEKAIKDAKFREDLYYRLNVISITLPPLRSRKQDLPLLIEHFVNLYSEENHKKINSISQQAQDALTSYNWPGNIRELENIIERAVILDTDSAIDVDDLPDVILNGAIEVSDAITIQQRQKLSSLKDAMKEPEKVYILKILQEVGWNKKKAAVKLGVNRTTLYNKLRQYKITIVDKIENDKTAI
ncbi:MAG: sigma-54 dependent transcriptional regulator [Candidatus Omnitrophota bacterium]